MKHTLKRSGSDGGRRRRSLLLGGGGGGRDAAGNCSGVWGRQRVFSSSEEDIFSSFLAVVFLDVEVEMSARPKRRREEEEEKRKRRGGEEKKWPFYSAAGTTHFPNRVTLKPQDHAEDSP